MIDFSVVVPALDEEASIGQLHGEIVAALEPRGSFEILFVDDGSTDGTWERMRAIAAGDPRVKVIRFSRNFGKSAAYTAAFAQARGALVVTMDADLQDDPAELGKLLERLEGHDVVIGWKQHRLGNEPHKTLPSKVFNGLNRLLFGLSLKDQNSGYRLMRLPVARSLELYGDLYRFIPQLSHLAGFRVAEVGVVHRKRQHGASKYGLSRFWTGLLDLLTVRFITGFRRKPLHFFGTLGLLPTLLGLGLEGYVLVMKLLGSTFQEHVAAIIVGVMLVLIGFQCIVIGLIGEMLTAPVQPQYLVVEAEEAQAHVRAREA